MRSRNSTSLPFEPIRRIRLRRSFPSRFTSHSIDNRVRESVLTGVATGSPTAWPRFPRGDLCDEPRQIDPTASGSARARRLVRAIAWVVRGTVWLETPAFAQKDGTRPAKTHGPLEAPAKVSDLLVHEWGTFLGINDVDGTALDGMYHEEHALPSFVHGRGKDQLKLPNMLLKGETHVIYFYTKERQKVRVGVGFPRGVWTQWYPEAAAVRPNLATRPSNPANSRTGESAGTPKSFPAGPCRT